jgi:hypothetical protein
MPILSLLSGPRSALALAAKRLIDLVGGALGLIILTPLLCCIALAIIITDGRPVLYRQERVGLHGRRFKNLCGNNLINTCPLGPASGVKIIFGWHGDMALRDTRVAQYLGHARRQGLPFRLRQNRKDIGLRNAMRWHSGAKRN